jgi:glycine dehydrogenase
MLSIRNEIKAIEENNSDKKDNALKNAPHTQWSVVNSEWPKGYSREHAAFPLPYVKENKFWPAVARVNNTYGDRNLICTCEPVESYIETEA